MTHFQSSLNELTSQLWVRFMLTVGLGFLVGLEFREYLISRQATSPLAIGSARTYAFIALLGFVLYLIDPSWHLYLVGMLALTLLFTRFYRFKLEHGSKGIHQFMIGYLVFTFGPVAQLLPMWFLILLFVTIILLLGSRSLTQRLVATLEHQELVTLSKFLLLSAVILPLLPHEPILPELTVTPFSIWLAVVVISTISYVGYILRRYVFTHNGYVVTGILGGLYSSTATTVVLSRETQQATQRNPLVESALLAATGMMYFRLLLLVVLLSPSLVYLAAAPLVGFGTLSLMLVWFLSRQATQQTPVQAPMTTDIAHNPLAMSTALLFAFLFVLMMAITHVVSTNFGSMGLEALSLVVGFTDIDPFVMSLLNGGQKSMLPPQIIGSLVMAAGSNNLLKALYTQLLGSRQANRRVGLLLGGLGILTLFSGWMIFSL